MPYIVTSTGDGSNRHKVEGVFQEEISAKFFKKKLQLDGLYRRYFIEHHEFKDWCPEISKFVLSGKAS